MLPESALAEMYPVIMTPSHDGKYFHNYTLSLLNIVHTNASLGLPLQVMMQRGESLITRARNNCVARFLENKNGRIYFGLTPTSASLPIHSTACFWQTKTL